MGSLELPPSSLEPGEFWSSGFWLVGLGPFDLGLLAGDAWEPPGRLEEERFCMAEPPEPSPTPRPPLVELERPEPPRAAKPPLEVATKPLAERPSKRLGIATAAAT